MVEYPSIKDIQHPLECGTPSEMLHYGLEYHCAEYDVLVQKCTKNIISHYTITLASNSAQRRVVPANFCNSETPEICHFSSLPTSQLQDDSNKVQYVGETKRTGG